MIRGGSRHAVIGADQTRRTFAGVRVMPRMRGFAGHATEIWITEGERTNPL